jgi:hypothetical protein
VKKYLLMISITSALFTSAPVFADESTQLLSVCLTDSLNGKERKELAKWVFLAMSSHSVIKPYAKVSEQDLDDSNKFVGELITRLMTEDCPDQVKAAVDENGPLAIQNSFRVVGEVAMQELMADQGVTQSLSGFERYIDQEKINKVFQ